MTTLAIKIDVPIAVSVMVTEDTLSVDLSDGRTIRSRSHGSPALSIRQQERGIDGD